MYSGIIFCMSRILDEKWKNIFCRHKRRARPVTGVAGEKYQRKAQQRRWAKEEAREEGEEERREKVTPYYPVERGIDLSIAHLTRRKSDTTDTKKKDINRKVIKKKKWRKKKKKGRRKRNYYLCLPPVILWTLLNVTLFVRDAHGADAR